MTFLEKNLDLRFPDQNGASDGLEMKIFNFFAKSFNSLKTKN